MQERVRETFESPVVPAAIPVGSRLMRGKYLYTVLPTTHYKQILSSQTQTHLRDGDGGGTERVVAVQLGTYYCHVEGGQMAWAAHHCGRVACWGCEVHTMGGAAAHGWGLWVRRVCCHVSVCVRAVWVQLGCAGECMLCRAWARPEVGCKVHWRGLGRVGEAMNMTGAARGA